MTHVGGSSWISCWIRKSFNCATWPRPKGDRPGRCADWMDRMARPRKGTAYFDHLTWLIHQQKIGYHGSMTNILLVLLVDGFKFVLPPYVGWWSAMTNVCFRGETTIIPNQNTIGDTVNSHDWYKWRMSPTNMIGEYNSWIQSTENIRRYVEHLYIYM